MFIEEQEEIKEKFLKDYSQKNDVKFNWRKKIILFLFLFQFVIMIWGVSSLGWWFQEVAAMFFGVAIIIMFISGLSEKEGVNGFITGASEVVGVALIIGLARAINIIMENGMISDTLLYNKWLKFVMPLLVIIAVLVIIILYVMSVFFR